MEQRKIYEYHCVSRLRIIFILCAVFFSNISLAQEQAQECHNYIMAAQTGSTAEEACKNYVAHYYPTIPSLSFGRVEGSICYASGGAKYSPVIRKQVIPCEEPTEPTDPTDPNTGGASGSWEEDTEKKCSHGYKLAKVGEKEICVWAGSGKGGDFGGGGATGSWEDALDDRSEKEKKGDKDGGKDTDTGTGTDEIPVTPPAGGDGGDGGDGGAGGAGGAGGSATIKVEIPEQEKLCEGSGKGTLACTRLGNIPTPEKSPFKILCQLGI